MGFDNGNLRTSTLMGPYRPLLPCWKDSSPPRTSLSSFAIIPAKAGTRLGSLPPQDSTPCFLRLARRCFLDSPLPGGCNVHNPPPPGHSCCVVSPRGLLITQAGALPGASATRAGPLGWPFPFLLSSSSAGRFRTTQEVDQTARYLFIYCEWAYRGHDCRHSFFFLLASSQMLIVRQRR